MIAGKRWWESRSVKRPTVTLPGPRVALRVSTPRTRKLAESSTASTRNESPTTVTRRCSGITAGWSRRTSHFAARPTVSRVRPSKSTRAVVAR